MAKSPASPRSTTRSISVSLISIPAIPTARTAKASFGIGKVLKQRGRKGLWLASKIGPRKYDDFMRMLDVSLTACKVDHVDLLHVHALMGPATWRQSPPRAALTKRRSRQRTEDGALHRHQPATPFPKSSKPHSNGMNSIAPRWR